MTEVKEIISEKNKIEKRRSANRFHDALVPFAERQIIIMEQNQNTKDLEKQLQKWVNRKSKPSSNIHEIQKTVNEWKKNPETLIQSKAIIAEKIADKSAYDQLPVMLSLLACVLAASAPILENINIAAWAVCGLAMLLAILTPIIWTMVRCKSDYYNELQIIIDELARQNADERDQVK